MEGFFETAKANLIYFIIESFYALKDAVFVGINHRLNIVWIFFALFLACLIYFLRDRENSISTFGLSNIKNVIKYCLPRSVFLHWSSLLDYKFYFVNSILTNFITFTPLVITVVAASDFYTALLGLVFVEGDIISSTNITTTFYTIFAILSLDFALWVSHYITHKVPMLWEFHKIHHAAAVLNPVTAYRIHPVEKIVQGICIAIILGFVNAIFIFFIDGDVRAFTIWSTSIATIGSNFYANLRHSHIWLDFGSVIGRVVSSPAQHFIHHSTAKEHLDKNFAIVFSLWDWIFGTLVIPKEKTQLNIGLANNEHLEYSSVWGLYFTPFAKARKLFWSYLS